MRNCAVRINSNETRAHSFDYCHEIFYAMNAYTYVVRVEKKGVGAHNMIFTKYFIVNFFRITIYRLSDIHVEPIVL